DDVVPEFRGRERLPQRQGRARVDRRAERDRHRVVVIEGQAAVQRVVAVQAQAQATEAGERTQPPVVRHHAGLGHPGGARGEDVERLVLGQHRGGGRRVRGGGGVREAL